MIFAIVMDHSASSWGLSPTSYLPDDFGSRHGPMMVLTPGIRAGWTGGEGSGGGGGGRSPWRSWSGAESAVVFCVGTDNRKRMTVAKLYFRYGAMNSGKSTALLQAAFNYEERGQRVLLAKPVIDTKGASQIVSRLGVTRGVDFLLAAEGDVETSCAEQAEYVGPDALLDPVGAPETPVACLRIGEAQCLTPGQVDSLMRI